MASSDREFVTSGTIASVNSPYSAPIHHLKTYFKPIQEGEGDASPSNIRAISGRTALNIYQKGKNLFNPNDLIRQNFSGDTTTHNVRTDHVIPVIPGKTITWTGLATSGRYVRFYDINGNVNTDYTIEFWNRTTYTFTVPTDMYYIRVMWYESPDELTIEQVIESNPIIEYGDTATAFEPYTDTNTIPITFTTIGKNLIHTKYPSRTANGITFTVNSDWTVTTSGTATASTWLTPGLTSRENKASKIYYTHLSAGTYFLTGGISKNEYVYLVGIKEDGTVLSLPVDTGNGVKYTFDFDLWVYPQIGILKDTSSNRTFQIQLERSTSATTFEPYSETSTTIYGGYVDPAEGKIVAEYIKIAPTKEQFGPLSDYGVGYRTTSGIYEPTASGVVWNTARQQQLCNKAVIANPYSESAETYGEYMGVVYTQEVSPTIAYARISEALYQSLEAGETVEFTYKLATPVTYNIPSQMLRTLIGNSKYWSDANDIIEVTYEIRDSMEMIEARKRVMQPQLLSKEGDGVKFHTKLQLPLKEDKISWKSDWWINGTPSLTNVRIIVGKDQLHITNYKSKNIGDLVGFSASINELKTNNLTNSCYSLTNNYNSISNVVGNSVTVTVPSCNDQNTVYHFSNGYFGVRFRNLEFNKYYIVSFAVTNITNNPLNASLSDMILENPRGWSNHSTSVVGNRVYFRYYHKLYETYPTRNSIVIHVCGMTATFSNFMVTLDGEQDQTYEPYIPTIGKNLAECIAQNRTQAGGNFNVRSDGTIECSGIPTDYTYCPIATVPVSSSMGTVSVSGLTNTTNVVWEAPIIYDMAKNKIATISGGSRNTDFTIDLSQYPDAAILYLCVKRSSNNTPMSGIIKPQVELGSTTTEFEPYNNSYYKALTLPNMSTNYLKLKATEMISDGWFRYFPNPLKGATPGDYWIGCQSIFGGNDQQGARVCFVDIPKNSDFTIIGDPMTNWAFGETLPEGYVFPPRQKFTLTAEQAAADYIVFECNSGDTTIDTFLNAHIYIVDNYYGKYEPWSNTLYGGELDLNTGILKVTHDSIYLYASGKQYNYFYTTVTDMAKGAIESLNADMYCNRLPVCTNVSDTQTDSGVAFYANGIIRFLDADYSSLTPDEYNVQLKDNRPFLTYKLKDPKYFQLDPQIIKTIKGLNILTTNADTISIKYWAH